MVENSDIVAVDIDLRKITIVSKMFGVLLDRGSLEKASHVLNKCSSSATLLIEIAGPVMHHTESHSYRKWVVYNSIVAGLLALVAHVRSVLVATSTKWTCGYKEEERQAIAGIKPIKQGKKRPIYAEPHDIRECRAMIYSYENKPKNWVPLAHYLEEL